MNKRIEIGSKRVQFGTRFLNDESSVFEHNAWDRIEWTKEQIEDAEAKIKENSSEFLPLKIREDHLIRADHYWNEFYKTHEDKFFKDRHWLFTEFPELLNEQNQTIFEVGCGVGNTILPILSADEKNKKFIYCCDFSSIAISLLKKSEYFDEKRCVPFVCDITNDNLEMPFSENSVDIIVMIFTLSAISPSMMSKTLSNLIKFLKPSGLFLFRDYGRYDMAQLRFKKGHCIEENFYIRGDGTMAYFFTPEEVDNLMVNAGLEKISLFIDKRLQVNRGKQLKMYRLWIQAKYRKKLQ